MNTAERYQISGYALHAMKNPPHPGDFILTQIIELLFRLCRG
jgi:hypothetical protein